MDRQLAAAQWLVHTRPLAAMCRDNPQHVFAMCDHRSANPLIRHARISPHLACRPAISYLLSRYWRVICVLYTRADKSKSIFIKTIKSEKAQSLGFLGF